jgi:dienelactone hydrolase
MAGGAWVEGPYTNISQVVLRMARLGVAVVSVRYRLANETNHFPDPVIDLKTAASWLDRNAGELDLDPRLMISSGYSSGGHLAMLAAVTYGEPTIQPMEGTEVRFIGSISFAGPVLLSRDLSGVLSAPAQVFLDCLATQCVDPDRAAPLRYFDAGDPAILGLWGDADVVEPWELGSLQHQSALAAGMDSQFELFPGLTHADIGDSADFDTVYGWMQRQFEGAA